MVTIVACVLGGIVLLTITHLISLFFGKSRIRQVEDQPTTPKTAKAKPAVVKRGVGWVIMGAVLPLLVLMGIGFGISWWNGRPASPTTTGTTGAPILVETVIAPVKPAWSKTYTVTLGTRVKTRGPITVRVANGNEYPDGPGEKNTLPATEWIQVQSRITEVVEVTISR